MADSGALRQRRSKAHKSGDHRLCGSRCSVAGMGSPVLSLLPSPAPDAELDAVAEMRRSAARLVAVCEADPANVLAARELRMTLAQLMPRDAGGADADLTGLFAALQA